MGKLINKIPGSFRLIASLPGLALRTHVESLDRASALRTYIESLSKALRLNKRSQSLAPKT